MRRTNTRSGMYPLMYYNHNVHFESYAATMAGQFGRARRTADKLASNVMSHLADMPMLEAFIPQQYFVLLRFAKWDEVLALPAPGESLTLTTIIWHYARQQTFLMGLKQVPPDTPVGVLNTAGQLFAVAQAQLEGRIRAAAGDREAAIERYEAAVKAQDALAYDEPPTWYYPVRETLGAALLAAGKAAQAEQVFREDLRYNPRNGRSLFGVWKSLDAQGKKVEAARARAEFDRVWAVADVTLRIEDL